MSDISELPTKVTKLDAFDEGMMEQSGEEPQEEWLSEEMITDDDEPMVEDKNDDGATSEDTSLPKVDFIFVKSNDNYKNTADDKKENVNLNSNGVESLLCKENINNFNENLEVVNNGKERNIKARIDELDEFLIKNDGNTVDGDDAKDVDGKGEESDLDESPKHTDKEEDDGHNTDDLLRILGPENSRKSTKKRIVVKTVKDPDDERYTDEDSLDDDIFEGAQIRTLKLAKNSVIRKTIRKSSSANGDSSDELEKLKRFRRTKKSNNVASKSTAKSSLPNLLVKKVVRTVGSDAAKTGNKAHTNTEQKRKEKERANKVDEQLLADEMLYNEGINEEEFLEEDGFDLDDDFGGVEDGSVEEPDNKVPPGQVMRNPEQMDEEVPSDVDTDDSDYSFYDELPSSESEDIEEWFTLDIRAERAGDYIPLLGTKAETLLGTERNQVADKLKLLRQGLGELSSRSKSQAGELEAARQKLIELDALLSRT